MARRWLTAVAAVAAVAALSPVAYAAPGAPPVTHPDEVVMHAGDVTAIDPVDNDSDPDGDSLQVCRLGPDIPRRLRGTSVQDGDVVVAASRLARGTYTLVYYACDESTLAEGTITVRVRPARPTVEVIAIGNAPPGRLRIKNTFEDRTFKCTWGPIDGERVDGRTTVRPRSAVVIRVEEANVEIVCRSGNRTFGFGFVTDGDGEGRTTRPYSAKASGGGHAQTRLRSP